MELQDLEVYRKLFRLAIDVHDLTLKYPKFELYELGSQTRRSANACPALIAEGFGNKHTNIYTESISRAQGELRETMHHIRFAFEIKYIDLGTYNDLISRFQECSKMLFGLEYSLNVKKR
jgi:four helix bundle protein